MKILYFTPGNIAAPMQEIELEIMQDHIDQGNQVTALMCKGELPSCWVNPSHSKIQCIYCKSKLQKGYSMLSKPIEILDMYNLNQQQIAFVKNFTIEATNTDELKQIYIGEYDLGWALLSSLISKERDPFPVVDRFRPMLTLWAKTSLIAYFSTINHLKHKKYDIAYIYNGRTKDCRGIMRAIQSAGIKMYTYDRGGVWDTYGLFPDTFIHDLQRTEQHIIELWNSEQDESIKTKTAEEFYENRIKGKVTVGPAFMAQMKKNELPSGFDLQKKNISIFISSEDENMAIGDFWSYPYYKDQLAALHHIAKDISHFPEQEYSFYIRIHPNLKHVSNEYTDSIKKFSHPRFTVISADSPINSYELIKCSDKIITFCSTIAAEATYLNKPSIECGKSFFMNLGSNYLPQNHEQLIELIKTENLPPKPKIGIYMYAYWWVNFGIKAKRIQYHDHSDVLFNGKKIKAIWPLESLKYIKRQFDKLIK